MRGGKGAKQKGNRFEYEVVHIAEAHNLKAYRIPLSGQTPDLPYDVMVAGRTVSCKKRADGFKTLRAWLQGVDALALGADFEKPLLVVRLEDWMKLL